MFWAFVAGGGAGGRGTGKKAAPLRGAGGETWRDATLSEWPENDFRIFVGNLGLDVSDSVLLQSFKSKYSSVAMTKIVRDKKTGKSKGFGFVSFLNASEAANALRTMNGKYVGSRPVMLKTSKWKDRNLSKSKRKKMRNKRR